MSEQGDTHTDAKKEKTVTVGHNNNNNGVSFSMPVVDILTGRGFITGKSGSGKSNTASVVVEELLDAQFPVLIVDTDGEYYGLKEQYEMLHVGADEECDLQVGPEHSEKLADLALEQNVPIIVDVSGYLDESVADELIQETARQLFAKEKKLKRPFLMVIEECHEYIPEQGGMDEVGEMLIKIGKRGRKHGLGIVGVSQRPADVKKDFITQADWLVWHRLTWDNDTKVVGRVLGNDYKSVVQGLDDGEALVMADWEPEIQQVQWDRKRTFDAGATPGLEEFERPELKSVGDDLVGELEEISEQHSRRQDRIAQLEATVEELNDEKEALADELEAERQNNETVEKLAERLADVSSDGNGGQALDEIREEKNAEIRSLESELEQRDERIDQLESDLQDAQQELQQRPNIDERAVEAVEVLADEFGVNGEDTESLRRKLKSARERIDELESEPQEGELTAPDEYDDFVEDEFVQNAIENAKNNSDATPRYVKGVVAGILQRGDAASRRDIADDLDIETPYHIGEAMEALAERDVVIRSGSGENERADFAFESVEKIHERQARQQRTEDIMEQL